jgi:type II restriction enzyme
MSSSEKLRQTAASIGGGRGIFNEDALGHEVGLQESVSKLIPILQEEYPSVEFFWKKKITKREIVAKVNPKVPYNPEVENSFISPDGGVLFVKYKGKEYPILISEAKKQGTHFFKIDGITLREYLTKKQIALALSGKEQGKGNAIERAYKNIEEFKLYCEGLNYFPYVLFACGKDFESGSSILDRLDAMTRYESKNVNYVADLPQKVTVYVQKNYFTANEMFDKIYDIAKTSLKCIGV